MKKVLLCAVGALAILSLSGCVIEPQGYGVYEYGVDSYYYPTDSTPDYYYYSRPYYSGSIYYSRSFSGRHGGGHHGGRH